MLTFVVYLELVGVILEQQKMKSVRRVSLTYSLKIQFHFPVNNPCWKEVAAAMFVNFQWNE